MSAVNKSKNQVVKVSLGGSLPRSSSLPLAPFHSPLAPSCFLRLRKLPRLPRLLSLVQGSEGFLRPQEGPRGPGRLRGQGRVRGARESKREQERVRGVRPLSLTEDPRLLKASKGSQGFLRPQEGPRGPGRLREQGEWEGAREGEGEQGEQGP